MTEQIDDENTRLFYTKRGKEIDLDKVEMWASRHLSIENMAALMGIGRTSLYETIEENEQFGQKFYDAIESGKAQTLEMATNKLLELVEEGHPQSINFYLERRGGWHKTETIKNEHTGKDGTALQPPVFNFQPVKPKDD
jgi:hypothetical protein